MAHTRHIQKRMRQRGITTGLVNLVSQFGVEHGDKLILNKKTPKHCLKH